MECALTKCLATTKPWAEEDNFHEFRHKSNKFEIFIPQSRDFACWWRVNLALCAENANCVGGGAAFRRESLRASRIQYSAGSARWLSAKSRAEEIYFRACFMSVRTYWQPHKQRTAAAITHTTTHSFIRAMSSWSINGISRLSAHTLKCVFAQITRRSLCI
jgi:hypothetical protein